MLLLHHEANVGSLGRTCTCTSRLKRPLLCVELRGSDGQNLEPACRAVARSQNVRRPPLFLNGRNYGGAASLLLRCERRLEVVAPSPYRIKSPVPVCCGFDSLKLAYRAEARRNEGWCSRQDLHPHWRRSRRRASAFWATRAEIGAPTRNCTGLAPIPKECIA